MEDGGRESMERVGCTFVFSGGDAGMVWQLDGMAVSL